MKEPQRLMGRQDLTRKLLRSWRQQQPSRESLRRTASALGLATSTGLAAGTASATGPALAAGAAKTASVAAWSILLKSIAGVVVAGSVAVATAAHVWGPSDSSTHALPAETARNRPGQVPIAARPRPVPTTSAGGPPRANTMTHVVEQASHAASHPTRLSGEREDLRSSPATGPVTENPRIPLALEIAAIERARHALAAGDAATALDALRAYDGLGPTPTLRPEAILLRIDALDMSGNRPEAVALAKRFLDQYPRSPHVDRLHRLVDQQHLSSEY